MFTKEIVQIAKRVEHIGGRMFVVGGAVRDAIRGVEPMDFDFMISGITEADARRIVSGVGTIVEGTVVTNAPVFIARIQGQDFEFAMARKEIDVAPGKHGFQFVSNPEISPVEDFERRDVTIGAIGQEVISGRIFDPFGGISDVHAGIIRHVSARTFVQSPERVFRVASQAARFSFSVASETIEIMASMQDTFSFVPSEQIWRHIEKTAKQATCPERFIEVMVACDWIKFFPEIHVASAIEAIKGSRSVEEFVAGMIAGMSFAEEQSFFKRISCPVQVGKKAVQIKHFGRSGKPEAWVQGRDVFHITPPGVVMGQIVQWCFIGQINGIFSSKDEAIAWAESTFEISPG